MPDREITQATLEASRLIEAFMKCKFSRNFKFPSHFDLNKVHKELSRSEFINYTDHPSCQFFGSIAQEIPGWKAKRANWSQCGQFPKFGDHNNLLVQNILLWYTDEFSSYEARRLSMKEMTAFKDLDVGFLLTEGAVPGPLSFWAGSRWADKTWVDTHTTPIEVTWMVGSYQNHDLNDVWRVALPPTPLPAHPATPSTIKDESTASIGIARGPPITSNLSTPMDQETDLSMEDSRPAKKRSRSAISAPASNSRPTTSIPSGPPRISLDDWEPAPDTLFGRVLSRAADAEKKVDAEYGNYMRECKQEVAALKSQHEADTLTLASKIDALKSNIRTLTSQHKTDTLALTSKFDALASILTSKVDTLASNGLKITSDVAGGDTIAEADKPTMAMISDLQMQNAKLKSDNKNALELFAAQERHFHTRFLAIRRDLGRVQGQDKGEIVAVELEKLQRIRAGGGNNENSDE